MKRIGLIIGILFGITAVGVAVSPVASAVDIYQACKPGDTSVVCQAKNETGAEDLVKNIINILLTVASVVAVIMIIIGGIRYATSNGDSASISAAKNTILYSVIGLVIAIFSYAIVQYAYSQATKKPAPTQEELDAAKDALRG